MPNKKKTCEVCGAPSIAKQLCAKHYQDRRHTARALARSAGPAPKSEPKKFEWLGDEASLIARLEPDIEIDNEPPQKT